MQDKNSSLVTFALLILSVFLLYKAYQYKSDFNRYKIETNEKIYALENPEQEYISRPFYNVFGYEIPFGWHIWMGYPEGVTTYRKLVFNDYFINMASIGGKPEVFDVLIYTDPSIHTDEWWQSEIEAYIEDMDYPSVKKDIETEYGELFFINGNNELSDNLYQYQETYFYKLYYLDDGIAYLKIQMRDISNSDYTKYLEDFVMSIRPAVLPEPL